MELLWDTEIMTHNKNPKDTAKGKCTAFSPSHIYWTMRDIERGVNQCFNFKTLNPEILNSAVEK